MRFLAGRRVADGDGDGEIVSFRKAQRFAEFIGARRGERRARHAEDYAAKAHALGGNGEIFGGNAAINRAIGLIFRGGAGKKHNGRRVVKNVVA